VNSTEHGAPIDGGPTTSSANAAITCIKQICATQFESRKPSAAHLDDECVEHAASAHGLHAVTLDVAQLLPEQLAQVLRAISKLLLNKHL
jgi:hypothetical protein